MILYTVTYVYIHTSAFKTKIKKSELPIVFILYLGGYQLKFEYYEKC